MFVLLPPSEAKRSDDGLRRRVAATAEFTPLPELAPTREAILAAVAKLCDRGEIAAATALSLPAGERAEACRRNAGVLDAPLLPALDRYSGVVYQGFDSGSLTKASRRVAERSVLIFSGGFGVVRGGEGIPWYRIPASARLPELGAVTAIWRPVLAGVVPSLIGDEFAVDLRSTDYRAIWRPTRATADRVVAVRVLQRREAARGQAVEQVVSYHSKLLKGRLARALVDAATRRRRIDSADDVAAIAVRLGLAVRPTADGLDLVDAG
ncbi:MAG: YaaA family protein [Acidothermaceae bacterium]